MSICKCRGTTGPLPAAFAFLAVCLLGSAPVFGNGAPEEPTPLNADYEIAVSAIKARDWERALYHLNIAARAEPANADVQTELGYTYRNQKNYDLAFKHYNEALRLNPAHKGAHEYIGEAYVMVGDKARARQHLAALERICGKQCEEYEDLQKAIQTAK
jgi:tetratricopeptide (TPR) repeat protein